MARNIDFPLFFSSYMSALVYKARFEKDGIYKFDAVIFHGIAGIFTAVKNGVYSASSTSRIRWLDKDYNDYTDAHMDF